MHGRSRRQWRAPRPHSPRSTLPGSRLWCPEHFPSHVAGAVSQTPIKGIRGRCSRTPPATLDAVGDAANCARRLPRYSSTPDAAVRAVPARLLLLCLPLESRGYLSRATGPSIRRRWSAASPGGIGSRGRARRYGSWTSEAGVLGASVPTCETDANSPKQHLCELLQSPLESGSMSNEFA